MVRPNPVPPYCRVVELSAWRKGLEDDVPVFLADPDSGIGHGKVQLQLVGRGRDGIDAQFHAAPVGEFHRVAEQVGQDLA